MTSYFECAQCQNYLGITADNPTRELPAQCISELETWCAETVDPLCNSCTDVKVDGVPIQTYCFNSLQTIFQLQCESQSTTLTTSKTEDDPEGANLGVVMFLFIGILLIFICIAARKIWEGHSKKDNQREHLITEHDIHLDYRNDFPPNEYDRIEPGEYHDHEYQNHQFGRQTSGSSRSSGNQIDPYSSHPHHVNSHSREDMYGYQTHSGVPARSLHVKQNSDSSYSRQSASPAQPMYSVPNSHRHQPYARGVNEDTILEAQDTLRASGKESLRSRISNARQTQPLPPVRESQPISPGSTASTRERGDSTNQRQTRINTLLNQNTSTSSIYSGDLLLPSNPVQSQQPPNDLPPIRESRPEERREDLPPLRDRIRKYSTEKRSRSGPRRSDSGERSKQVPQHPLPLKDRIKSYSQSRDDEPRSSRRKDQQRERSRSRQPSE